MLALMRFLILGFVVCSVVYGALWFYLRARRRELLEAEFADTGSVEDHVRDALPAYDKRRTRFLFWAVYILPLCIVVAIVYFTNYH